MEHQHCSEAVIVEAVDQASEMGMYEIRGQMITDVGDTMVVTSEAGNAMVVTGDPGEYTTVVAGDVVVTCDVDETTIVVMGEAEENAMVVTNDIQENTMVVTGDAEENTMVVTNDIQENTMVVTGHAEENTTAVTNDIQENTMVVTGDADENTMVVTGDAEENTMVVTGSCFNPKDITASAQPVAVTSIAGDTMIVTSEAGDVVVVTDYKMTGTELLEVPIQVTGDLSNATRGQEIAGSSPQAKAAFGKPLLEALNLTLQAPDADGVVDRVADQVQTDNDAEGNKPAEPKQLTAHDLLCQVEQQTEALDMTPSGALKPPANSAVDEKPDEIYFVCVHGQTFLCKPQAGTPVKASGTSPAPAGDTCACSKSSDCPHADDAAASPCGERKLRNRKQKFTCNKCGGRFTQQASLDRHMSSHEDDSESQGAGEETNSESVQNDKIGTFRRRTRQQHREAAEFADAKLRRDRFCPDCGKAFSRLAALNLHKKQHEKAPRKKPRGGQMADKKANKGLHAKKQFKCEPCGLVLGSRYKLRCHERDHLTPGQSANFPCRDCSRVFSRIFNLQRHEKTHLAKKREANREVKSLSCKTCCRVFSRPLHLVRHEKLHIKENTLISCALCSETFEDMFSYVSHKKTHTKKNYYRDLQCDVCQRVVKGPVTLKRHMRTHTKEKPYPCRNGCNACFSSTSYRLNHERMHCKEGEDYLCTTCGQIFVNKAKLINHETKVHRGGLDEHGNVPHRSMLPCRHCGRIFYGSAVRKRHERIHTNEKPYMCQFCPKAFRHDNALLCHERVHTKERPYKCTVCDKNFSQSGHLRTHMRVHTREKPYQCRFCKQCFSHVGSRKNHERKHGDGLAEQGPQADGHLAVSEEAQENLQLSVLQDSGPQNIHRVTYDSLQEPQSQEDGLQEHPGRTCEDVQDPDLQGVVPQGVPEGMPEGIQQSGEEAEEDVTHKIILSSHPDHEMQAAVILQLLESGNRMANLEGLVHIVQS